MLEYHIIKPLSLNLLKRIRRNPPEFEFNIDYAYFLVSEIMIKTAYKLDNGEESLWVPLCAEITKGHKYSANKHLYYLCENFSIIGNILWRKNYSVGKCYAYKLAPFYFGDIIEFYTVTDKKLLKQLAPRRRTLSNNKFKKKYNFLKKYLDPEKLKINLSDLGKQIADSYIIDIDYKKILLGGISAAQIANGEFKFSYNPHTDGRIHTQITRLPKDFRKFLSYEGENLGEIDIAASIPTFLYYLLSKDIYNPNINNIISNTIYYRHYMFLKKLLDTDITEVNSFGEKLLSGKLYEHFVTSMWDIHLYDIRLYPFEYFLNNVKHLCGREFDGDLDDLRTVVKKNFLSMFNSKGDCFCNEQAAFASDFPFIHNWIKKFKEPNHKYFSYLLLQTESYFMLNIVAREINRMYKGKMPIFTMHDCLITTESNLKNLEVQMTQIFNVNLGFKPILKSTLY